MGSCLTGRARVSRSRSPALFTSCSWRDTQRVHCPQCAGPLKYSLSMLFPITAMLSVFGAAYGHTWVLTALQLIPQQVTPHPSQFVCCCKVFVAPQSHARWLHMPWAMHPWAHVPRRCWPRGRPGCR